MAPKLFRSLLGCLAAVVLLGGAFSGGLLVGWTVPLQPRQPAPSASQPALPATPTQPEPASPAITPTPPDPGSQSTTPANLSKLFNPFWQAWSIVHDQYVDQPVDDQILMQGAIRGMLEALGDQHSSYIDPDQYRQLSIPLEGSYEGIGAWVDDTSNTYLTITSPMPGSPAEKAGLKPGDQVIAVDGKDVTGIDPQVVLRSVIGPAGTQVTLTILRQDTAEPFDVVITRAKITVPTLESRLLEGGIAYVALYDFGETTTAELKKALADLLAKKPSGIILDLRNNGGGYLDTSIEVASQFIGEGVILYERYADGSEKGYTAIPGGLATDLPLVVLVNEGSASASEIVAGAVQDTGRGRLVGMTTFGKGSVQNWVELDGGQGVVRVTIAYWLTPQKRQIHAVGLTPDVTVPITEADVKAQTDPQLQKAVELLSAAR